MESVITRERFTKGKTYGQYIESGIRNREQFDDNYGAWTSARSSRRL